MGWHRVYIPDKGPKFCIKCRARLSGDSPFCNNCGAKRYRCSCGEFLDWGMKFCPKCGRSNPEEIRLRKENIKKVALGFFIVYCIMGLIILLIALFK